MTSTQTFIETSKIYPSDGFIVCLTTAWPGIYNINTTNKTPAEFLKSENDSYHFPPPTPYKIVYSKRIEDPEETEKKLYEIMYKYAVFLHKDHRFYKISYEEILSVLIDLDFKLWTITCKEEENRTYNCKELTPFMFRGAKCQRNYYGHTWTNDWNPKKWVGIYDYKTKKMDTSAPEYVFPNEYESEYESNSE